MKNKHKSEDIQLVDKSLKKRLWIGLHDKSSLKQSTMLQ